MNFESYFIVGLDSAHALPAAYNYWLVAASYVIATIASFAFLRVAGRIVELRHSVQRMQWLAVGALALGGGIWSMHFVAILARQLPSAVSYDPLITAISVVPAVLAAGVALQVMAQPAMTVGRLLIAGALVGAGIGTMHYTGMAAIHTDALVRHDPILFVLSLVAAVVFAIVALQVRFWIGGAAVPYVRGLPHVAAAAILGFAVTAIDYTAMASTHYFGATVLHGVFSIQFSAVVTAGVTLILLLAISIITSYCLWRGEESFRYLFAKNPMAMWVHDRKTYRIMEANEAACAAYGYNSEEFRRITIFDLHSVEDRARVAEVATRTDQQFDMQERGLWQHFTKNGAVIDSVVITGSVTFYRKPARLVIIKDVTRQHRAETRLAQVEAILRQSQKLEAIGQLTSGIAHDFNNVLAIIIAKLEGIADELPTDSPLQKKIESALTASDRGSDLVSRLMMFARRRPPEPQELSVVALLQEFASLLSSALSSRVRLQLEVGHDLPNCRIDRSGFETAILNLVVNARDAMPDGGELGVTARSRVFAAADVKAQPELREGNWVEIAVRDTGSGISPEVQAQIFEPFFTTKAEGKGTGLGLVMVYGFVQQSGGFLMLRSSMGEGTTFLLYLPAIVAGASLPTQEDPSGPPVVA
ncbi:MHYT domain-containing protein [Reyranella sp. CPCC 100927]|uniref:MHYT domain-containing protein n=1 Tax=Reyranella sp. CPCC 100927 TaxID=2599616 RepID=UPI0011B7D257|nr:MHYT domain-containing protein [Reyranella sp. CPCC 100927]TWT05789.1 PAS domain S-box protein [Reyranella sp. CPCC 100927]